MNYNYGYDDKCFSHALCVVDLVENFDEASKGEVN